MLSLNYFFNLIVINLNLIRNKLAHTNLLLKLYIYVHNGAG